MDQLQEHELIIPIFVTIVEVQPITETHTVATNVNVVDVNVTTRSKATKE
jgi:hypothetical protein